MSLPSSEQWRPVVGYEGSYEVSNHGRVRSVDRWVTYADGRQRKYRGQMMRPFVSAKGYLRVRLGRTAGHRGVPVHGLVLEAFIGPRPDGMEGCHSNGDKSDCSVSNLRWDTRSANALDKVLHGAHHEANKTTCPRRHLLAEPNLVPSAKRDGWRRCKACSRAHSNVHKAKLRGEPQDFGALADDHYARIMQAGGTASSRG